MTLCTIETAMTRIMDAREDSPIAVFRDVHGRLDVMFANTVSTRKRIDRGGPGLVGIFDGSMPRERVRSILRDALNEQPAPRVLNARPMMAPAVPRRPQIDPMME